MERLLFPWNSSCRTIILSLCLFLFMLNTIIAQYPKPETKELRGHTLYTVLKPGDIPAIFDPQFIPVETADSLYYDEEPLLVVAAGDEVKAYSTWHLDEHEVVNDNIGGTAIAVTW